MSNINRLSSEMQRAGKLNTFQGLVPFAKAARSVFQKKWVQIAILLSAIGATALVIGAPTPPAIPAVNLAVDPLFASASTDKPVLALALSVEFPTVGAQYTEDNYSNETEFLGYYDAESCYAYNDTPTETVATGLSTADYKRFDRTGGAIALTTPDPAQPTKTSRKCVNAFSGNYLNWASNSGIDMLRLALSGGDRYIDEVGLTVLQRAVIPNGDPICMWNTSNFPAKRLRKDGGGTGSYYGAVPTAMITAAGGNDIWAANTLNRIYFGTSQQGDCTNTGGYKLGAGTPSVAKQIGAPIVNKYETASTALTAFGGTECATEGNACSFTGVKEVLYGAPTDKKKPGGWITFPASGGLNCTNSMTGSGIDPAPSIGKKCYIRDYSGPWTPTPGTSALNSEGYFFSRVQVCNSVSGTLQDVRDYGLCTRYGNNFKPTGTIQKYSDNLRIGAFGYLMDQTASYDNGRFGGVLRAPIKNVGVKTFDISGADNTPSTGNPNAEWDKATGVFYPNPDGDTTQNPPISGVINYLNKFGRTGPTPGLYKKFDPVGEMYYQTLRYLQGLQPSPDAVSSITPAMYDGFPVFTSWTDPYGGGRSSASDYSCLKSNIVVVGDVNTHDGNRMPSVNTAANIPNISTWTSLVQDFEKGNVRSYTDGQSIARTTGNPNPANANPPGNIVVGAAYWAHTQDIRGTGWTDQPTLQRPGLRVKSFFFDVNEYSNSTDTDYRRNRNQFFTAAKYGGFEADPRSTGAKPYNTFGNPFKKQDGTDDNNVWQKSTQPGEAASFYLQSSARGVLAAFDDIFKGSSDSARSIAGAAVPSSKISGPSALYQAAFSTDKWSGDVAAYPFTIDTNGAISIATNATWTAATQLDALANAATVRNIVVGRTGAATSPNATAFKWADILDQSLRDSLNKASPTAATDTLGEDRLNFLRGDRTKEGNPFRVRGSRLGDIVNAGVVYSGTPTAVINGGASFATFITATAGRTPVLFVGANDGMLHALNASNGDELFGYIPSWMQPKLSALTAPAYASNHQAYVDATPAVSSAKVGSDWKTVLVSGTGAGGRGVFALDVTAPQTFGPSNVMWEFTQNDDADMGFVVGKPQILKLRTTATGTPVYKWFAVVPSGVNNYIPDEANVFSTTGKPAVFILDLEKAQGSSWVEGTNYYKLSLPNDSALEATNAHGLINFESLLGNAGELSAIYMGDLHGKLWKLDFSLVGTAGWNFTTLSFKKSGAAIPMFVAKTAGGLVQPISAAPTIIRGPRTDAGETFYVSFGTGKYLEAVDKTSTLQNSVYLVYDNGVTTSANAAGEPLIPGRGRLQQLTAGTSTGVISGASFVFGRATSDTDTTQKSGWYFDFGTTGERQVFSGEQFGKTLIFGSLIPASTGGSGSCLALGGSGKDYRVDYENGSGKFVDTSVGIPGQFVLLENPDLDVVVKISDSTGRRVVKRTRSVVTTGTVTAADGGALSDTFPAGRLSWRQINNYRERKNE